MKIPINLASQPFRRDRAMLAASIAVSLVLVATLGILISLAMADRAQMADVRQDVDRMHNTIRNLTTEQSKLDAVMRQPKNAQVLETSIFLNSLLRRKGLSWTRIFADLEKVVPFNVRVIQIHPTVDAQNRVWLDMQLGAETPGPMIELLMRMADEPFGTPELKLEQSPTQAEPLYKYRLSVGYNQSFEEKQSRPTKAGKPALQAAAGKQ